MPTIDEARELLDAGKHISLLGIKDGQAYFAVDLSEHDDPYQHPLLETQGAFEDLRKFGPAIEAHEGAILAHARGPAVLACAPPVLRCLRQPDRSEPRPAISATAPTRIVNLRIFRGPTRP